MKQAHVTHTAPAYSTVHDGSVRFTRAGRRRSGATSPLGWRQDEASKVSHLGSLGQTTHANGTRPISRLKQKTKDSDQPGGATHDAKSNVFFRYLVFGCSQDVKWFIGGGAEAETRILQANFCIFCWWAAARGISATPPQRRPCSGATRFARGGQTCNPVHCGGFCSSVHLIVVCARALSGRHRSMEPQPLSTLAIVVCVCGCTHT